MSYIRWWFGIPKNLNFSFEKDTNNDGLADNWTGDSTACEIYEDNDCPHGQKIYFTTITSDSFDVRGNVTRIIFKYKFITGPSFTVTLTGASGVIFTDTFTIADFDWHYFEYEFLNSKMGDAYFIIGGTNANFILEDLVVVQDADMQDYDVNPVEFGGDQAILETEVHTINDEKFLVRPILYNYSQKEMRGIFPRIDKEHLKYLKTLLRKKFLVRMHDDRLIACRLKSLEEDYWDGEQGRCQHYVVNVNLEAI